MIKIQVQPYSVFLAVWRLPGDGAQPVLSKGFSAAKPERSVLQYRTHR